jgi:uncharacterized protein (TIGR02266 family)
MTKKSEMHERREAPRFDVALRVQYPQRQEYLWDWTINLSAGGLFIRTDETMFQVGDEVHLELSFPGLLKSVTITGKVAWKRPKAGDQPSGIGVRVDGDADRRRLAELALAASSAEDTKRTTPYCVLVVEDNPHITEMYRRAMERMSRLAVCGVTVGFASQGHEALAIIKSTPVDIMLCDVYMPVMDGLSLIKTIRRMPDPKVSKMPILVVSAGDEREHASAAGADAFLRKPIQFGQLLETIISLLRLGA